MSGGPGSLTEKELEVLRLLAHGHDGKSAAQALGLSVPAVNERLREARRKLGVGSSREAARLVFGGQAPQKNDDEEIGVAGGAGAGASRGWSDERAAGARRLPILVAGGIMLTTLVAALVVLGSNGSGGSAASPERPATPRTWPNALISADDYRGEEQVGEGPRPVGYRLDISPQGRATGCRITSSSGSTALDQKTCRILIMRARFVPAADADGEAVASSYSGVIDWASVAGRGR